MASPVSIALCGPVRQRDAASRAARRGVREGAGREDLASISTERQSHVHIAHASQTLDVANRSPDDQRSCTPERRSESPQLDPDLYLARENVITDVAGAIAIEFEPHEVGGRVEGPVATVARI